MIGGGGSGIPVYRALQRNGISFAAGILQENDLDWPVAKALASELVTVPAYQLPEGSVIEKAKALIRECGSVIVCTRSFGAVNEANLKLRDYAEAGGLIREADVYIRKEKGADA